MKRKLETELHTWEKADNILYPAINTVVFGALAVSVWDLVVLQHSQYSFEWLNMIGLVLFICGLIIYSAAQLTLGKLYSQRLRVTEKHELVTYGIYEYVRHPYYAGSILSWPGLTLLLNSVLGSITMLLLVLLILIRISFEEKMLIGAFGQQYVEYMKRTKKLIPFLY